MQTTRRNPCSDLTDENLEILREIARMQMGQGLNYDSKIMDRARQRAHRRFEKAQKRRGEAEDELEELEAERMHEALEKLMSRNSSHSGHFTQSSKTTCAALVRYCQIGPLSMVGVLLIQVLRSYL